MNPIVNLNFHENNGLPTSIYWENFFTEEELILIEKFPEWKKTKKASVFKGEVLVDSDQRITDVNWLEKNESNNFVYEKIAQVIFTVNAQFYQFDLTGLYETIQLGIYDSKDEGHYDWHMDLVPTGVPRKLSFSMLLSDPKDYEGGDLEVKINCDKPTTLEQKRGRAWLFPSIFLHRVTPVTKGVRKSLVVWAGGPAFR